MSGARLSPDDYPEVEARRRGQILVCHGDDSPDQWIDWLEPIQSRFKELHELSEEYGFALDAGEGLGRLGSGGEFLELIGVDVWSNPWEGSLISGVYRFGWIKAGTVRADGCGSPSCDGWLGSLRDAITIEGPLLEGIDLARLAMTSSEVKPS
jgi:hypothetical protein